MAHELTKMDFSEYTDSNEELFYVENALLNDYYASKQIHFYIYK